MDLHLKSYYQNRDDIYEENRINLSKVKFIYPWALASICISLIERSAREDIEIIFPEKTQVCEYLKRMHFDEFLERIGVVSAAQELRSYQVNERRNLNVQEILLCPRRDYFEANLEHFTNMFQNFGLSERDAPIATAIVGELGNNVFDHNLGSWPYDISGAVLIGQNYPKKRYIEFVVADPGIGFIGSLKPAYPQLKNDVEAIKHGLAGNTGRINEDRGNGLKIIQQWTIEDFSGVLYVHSGSGFVRVNKDGQKDTELNKISGTIMQFMIYYN